MNHTFWTFGNNAAANWDHFVQNIMGVLNAPVTAQSSALIMALTVGVIAVVILNGIATVRRAEMGMRAMEATRDAMRARQKELQDRRERGEVHAR